jgi:uncharacterized SAM-binding protein YcdF (DUF218 family)
VDKMFILKKTLGPLFYPLSLCLALLAAGLIMLWSAKRQRAGRLVVFLGVALLIVMSYSWIPGLITRPLESRYPPLREVGHLSATRYIVVFGGGHMSDTQRPANANLSYATLARLVEGIRLHRLLPGAKLILTGGAIREPVSEAEMMAQTALSLGINRRDMILESASLDTEGAARLLRDIVGGERFILVTSASHMPRSLILCHEQGLDPVPAPADFLYDEERPGIKPGMFFPSPKNLDMAERAVHEYLGTAWARWKGAAD